MSGPQGVTPPETGGTLNACAYGGQRMSGKALGHGFAVLRDV